MARVYVVGSINMDVIALAARHPRKGETVRGTDLTLLPGGKGANQAVAARRAGVATYMVAMLGNDTFGEELRSFLLDEQVDMEFVATAKDTPTGTALITVADAENTIVVVPGANDKLLPERVRSLPFDQESVIVAQFEAPQETVLAAFQHARSVRARTVLNPAPAAKLIRGLLDATDILVVNESELSLLVHGEALEQMNAEDAISAARELRARDSQTVIVTLGASGAIAVAGQEVVRVQGHRVPTVDTTGAGDCFVGNLAASLAEGRELAPALDAANRAASICVQTLGAAHSMPYHRDRDRRLAA